MKQTAERLFPGRNKTVEERVIDAMHRFAYSIVEEYVGVEVDSESVTHAAQKYQRPGVSFVQYDGVTLPFDDASFDLLISFQVIEHVRDPEVFLLEARRVTRSGKRVLIVTPNRNHRLADGETPWNRYHVREFSPGELEAVMRKVFEIVEIFGIRGSPLVNEIEKRRVARARRLARLDPLGLRYVLPEGVDTRLRTFLRRRRSGPRVPSTLGLRIGVEHVHRAREDVETSLDLLAVGLVT